MYYLYDYLYMLLYNLPYDYHTIRLDSFPAQAVQTMTNTPGSSDGPADEAAALRERLSRLSEASVRINRSLDLDTVLQDVLDSARSITGARYGVMTLLDDDRRAPRFLSSGMTPEEALRIRDTPDGMRIFAYLNGLPEPLRVPDLLECLRSLGLPGFRPPASVGGVLSFLAAPLFHREDRVGNLFVADREGAEFTPEDESTLVMFASQAALVIANARRYREERRARAGLEALVNASPVGVVVFDAGTGTPVSFSLEALRIQERLHRPGQSSEELLATLSIREADGGRVPLAELMAQLMSAGEMVRAQETTLLAPDGRSVPVLVNASPVRAGEGEDGEVDFYVVTLQDLAELEELGRLRAEFLGLVSQQLRTPLAAVRGAASTLLESGAELEPAETRQFHRIILDQSDRMRRLIGDLLDVARIETGTLAVSPAPLEVAELVESARQRFLGRGGRRALEIELDLAPGLPAVLADGQRMPQALGHLLAHLAAGLPLGSPVVRVSAAREGGMYVAISVAAQVPEYDSDEPLGRLGRFPQVDDEDRGDSSLGLSVCRGIVEAHGGRLRVETGGDGHAPGFTVTLPAAEWETGAFAPPVVASDTVRAGGAGRDRLRVLAVDDDPQALRYLRDALWNAGCFPIATGDPGEVPRLIEEERPHLALLDATLPGQGGLAPELLRSVLETADAPVILVTSSGQEEAMAHALDLGVSDYLVKPFSPAELSARIRAALRRHDQPHLVGPSAPYALGNLTIDFTARRVSVAGSAVALTPNEYGLLAELALNAGRTLAHDHLLQRVWSPGRRGQRWLLREVMRRLRSKLGDDADNPSYIFTVPRAGYRMGPAAETE